MHLQLERCCAMQVASKKLFDIRKEELLTSHLNKLGDSLTSSASRLPEYSTLVVNNANGEVAGNITSIFCHIVTCLGTNQCYWDRNQMLRCFLNIPQCLLVNMTVCDPVSNELFPYTFATCRWLCPSGCIQETLRQQKEELLTSHLKKLGDSLTCLFKTA